MASKRTESNKLRLCTHSHEGDGIFINSKMVVEVVDEKDLISVNNINIVDLGGVYVRKRVLKVKNYSHKDNDCLEHQCKAINFEEIENIPEIKIENDSYKKVEKVTFVNDSSSSLPHKNDELLDNKENESEFLIEKEPILNPFIAPMSSGKNVKYKRESSIRAEMKLKRALEKEKTEVESSSTKINTPFCEPIKNKKINSIANLKVSIPNKLSIIKQKTENITDSPLHKQFIPHKVLKDISNSPSSKFSKSINTSLGQMKSIKEESENNNSSQFFLQDLNFLKHKKKKSKSKEKKALKKYQKLVRANTHFNQGYKTVIPKRKSIVDLMCYSTPFYSTSKKQKLIFFDLENSVSVHNNINDIKPILIDEKKDPVFQWNEEKEVVEIVRHVDLGSDYTWDDFVHTKIGEKLSTSENV